MSDFEPKITDTNSSNKIRLFNSPGEWRFRQHCFSLDWYCIFLLAYYYFWTTLTSFNNKVDPAELSQYLRIMVCCKCPARCFFDSADLQPIRHNIKNSNSAGKASSCIQWAYFLLRTTGVEKDSFHTDRGFVFASLFNSNTYSRISNIDAYASQKLATASMCVYECF